MKKKRTFWMALLTVSVGILTACGNTPEEPDVQRDNAQEVNHPDSSLNETEVPETTVPSEETSEKSDDLNKGQYLKKLNEMEEADRNGEAGTTTAELVNQEKERYEKWDAELNEIYGILQKQLSAEQMEQLRKEQRRWIEQRDEKAKESSLAYQGGSMESLEYVATQASLTRERCFELVAKYM